MTATGAVAHGPASTAGSATQAGTWRAFRTERRKLRSQLVIRMLALICVAGPLAFSAVLKIQSGTPSDALFGVWVHSSGFAISLVVLGFAGAWGFPLLAGVLAGDIFSAEDRHGTWKTILTRSCTRDEIIAGKLLAAMVFTIGLVALTTFSSLVAGLLLAGDRSLVDLSGSVLSPGRCLGLVLASWTLCVLPVLAYTSVAILLSVATRNGIVAVLGPVMVALVSQLLGLIGKGVWVHLLLIGSAFDGWHGLFTTNRFYGPLAVSSLVSLAWIAFCLGVSWRIFSRRNFAGVTVGKRSGWLVSARIVAIGGAIVALLAVACNWGPVGVTAPRLKASIAANFNNLTLLQQHVLGRAVPPGAALAVRPNCNRHAAAPIGPGDWTCNVDVYIPQPGAVPFQESIVTYEVSVKANGCYKAASPPAFIGQQTIKDVTGRSVVNPLFVVYGCFNTL